MNKKEQIHVRVRPRSFRRGARSRNRRLFRSAIASFSLLCVGSAKGTRIPSVVRLRVRVKVLQTELGQRLIMKPGSTQELAICSERAVLRGAMRCGIANSWLTVLDLARGDANVWKNEKDNAL